MARSYVYADISRYSHDSLTSLRAWLLADTGVAIAPGVDFDECARRVVRPAVLLQGLPTINAP